MNMSTKQILVLSAFIIISCNKSTDQIVVPVSEQISFGTTQKVNMIGYQNDIMEPFLSRDGAVLFFNNSNNPAVNTNIHYALKINDSTFSYQGELKGINTGDLEGVPTLDNSNILYFVSTRDYTQTLSTIYTGVFSNDTVLNVQLLPNISRMQAGWVNFDVEVSVDGNFLYFVDGRYDQNGGPYEANFVIAEKINNNFQRMSDQSVLNKINTSDLEYAACISPDMLELYFTRIKAPISISSQPQIFVSTRKSINEPFNSPYKIDKITGFVEAPTISPDGQTIYYHKRENDKFVLYMIRKEQSNKKYGR